MVRRAPLLLLLACSIAHADERSTAFTFGAMAGALQRTSPDLVQPEGVFGPRLSMSFEHGFPALPTSPGYNADVTIVPEIVAGAFVEHDRMEGFLGVGARGELRFAQKEMGLLRVTARGSGYLSARAIVLGDDRKPLGEIGLGEYFLIGRSARIGFEGSIVFGKNEMTQFGEASNGGGIVQAYFGWH